MSVDELLAAAQQSSYAPLGTEPTVVFEHDQNAEELLHALIRYFGEDDERPGVKLEVPGYGGAYVQRAHVYTFALPAEKGFGSSDAWFTPGIPDFTLVTVRCPADGAEFLVTRFDQRRPPQCYVHDQPMTRV